MALNFPLGPKNIFYDHLTPGTFIKALITTVHDRYYVKFTMRIVSKSEFKLTDVIELANHTFVGCSVPLPKEGLFGLGIQNKVYRAVLMNSEYTHFSPSAYLIDVGMVMPIKPWDPIYSLSPDVLSIPATAIACIYADLIDPFKQLERWRFVQEHLQEDVVVTLKVVCRFDTVLRVHFADDPIYKNDIGMPKMKNTTNMVVAANDQPQYSHARNNYCT